MVTRTMISKAEVQQLSEACVQDEPPPCSAACPLHVDVRGVLAAVADGEWTAALATLRKAVPFPGVLGRICPEPCRPACTRGEAGDPLRIADVERACADVGDPVPASDRLSPPIPRRRHRVAVVGGGLAGATAALDLARKGYQVVVHEAAGALGGTAGAHPNLPGDLLATELDAVQQAGASVQLDHRVDAAGFERLCAEFDALVLACGAGGQTFGLGGEDGTVAVDPVTRATGRDGVFAGGGVVRGAAGASPVESVSDGRRAATSVDRYLQGVSLTGAREAETARTTCLFTRTDGLDVATAVPMADPAAGYPPDDARAEAARCLQCSCLECVKSCAFLEHYGSYPSRYARRVLHNMMMIKGNHTANRLINSCSLCGLCAEVCPTGVDMGAMLKKVRRRMVEQQKMPPSAHDFAVRDMEFSNSEAFALARPHPGTERCTYAFFPGCQLAGSSPDDVRRVYAYLLDTLGDVGLILRCCGAPADWAGRAGLADAAWAEFDEEYARLGSPTLVVACTSCQQQFTTHRPDIPLFSLWTVLDEHGLPPDAEPAPPGRTLAVHDPCTARHERDVQDSVRRVLRRLGYSVEELPLSRERTECCSYGGLMWLANREVAEKTVQRRISASPQDYLTYCVMCRDLFAARGKRTVHLLDLLGGSEIDARATRPSPGYSQRHFNRARLKRTLLTTVWGESVEEPTGADLVRLRIPPEVGATLEDRLILVEDLQRVIAHAERTGARLLDRRTGHLLAHHRPREVTYWVEYTRDGEEYVVHRAYSHRVHVVGAAGSMSEDGQHE